MEAYRKLQILTQCSVVLSKLHATARPPLYNLRHLPSSRHTGPGNIVHARWTTLRTLLSTSPGVLSTISSNGPNLASVWVAISFGRFWSPSGNGALFGPDASKNLDRLFHYWYRYPHTPKTCVNGTCQAFILFLLPTRTNHDMPL